MNRIGILGCGNMGGAMAKAFAMITPSIELILFDVDKTACEALAQELSATAADSIPALVRLSDITLLAVKPQILPQIYSHIANVEKNHKFISIAAGVALETLQKNLDSHQVIRFMPNIAAAVSKAVTAVACSQNIDQDFKAMALKLAESCGSAFELPEKLFPAFIGISGSAIAYFFQFVHATALGGTLEGIPYNTAVAIATETYAGAAAMLTSLGKHPMELATSVMSAGGTTIEGISRLEAGAFNAAVIDAVQAASQKANNLELLARR